ncbi:MAG: cysteine synthase A [Candidatus Rokuibacteriota bacterium]|nr:MAG: cysteine synthase A [Candidatus Rokubacteria bacterium]
MPVRWDAHRSALSSIVEAVGRTPLVRLNRVVGDVRPPVYLKLEWYGPSGSLKDRIYLHMFEQAEARGDLKPGMRVLECSTGNASLKRLAEIRAGDPTGYWVPGQFDNADNIEAHYRTTGPEIWEQAGGIVGAFVASQGSGGTLTGVGRYLRERDHAVCLYAVEPDECALLSRRAWGPHGIEGIGDGFIPDNLDVSMLTGVITTTTEEALVTARRLAAEEGIFCGISTGCNVAAALKLAARHPDLTSIVTMANDTGQRYFTTPLCGETKHVDVPERAHPMDDKTRRELDRWQSKWEILR